MQQIHRIGVQVIPLDPFWVQVGYGIDRKVRAAGCEVVPVDVGMHELPGVDYTYILEELLAQEIDVFIILTLPDPLVRLITAYNIPIISLSTQTGCYEQKCNHPGITSPLGLYNVAELLCNYLSEQLKGRGDVLVIGGLRTVGEDGRTLLAGVNDFFAPYPGIKIHHIPTNWDRDKAYPQILQALRKLELKPDAIIGLSDPLALAGREACVQLGLLKSDTLVVGSNGDPQALDAIAHGLMAATVEISTVDFVDQLVSLALQAGVSQPLHFNYKLCLVTAENVMEVAANKLFAIAELPNQLLHVNRQREKQHLVELETSLAINRQVGNILDPEKLLSTIVELIRQNYNFSRVHFYEWSELNKNVAEHGGILSQALRKSEMVFIPDMHHSQHTSPDSLFPQVRTRIVLPVQLGETNLGVLDLQCDKVTPYSQEQLQGLQSLSNQLAIAINNAALYTEAMTARKMAEKADKLKTRLLANVSHELRTPLNIILGYTKAAMSVPNPYNLEFPPEVITDLNRIYKNGEYLSRLINDLLDLSRAEIDELAISPRLIDVKPLLEETFNSIANVNKNLEPVKWQFIAPTSLPMLEADPLRLRQILLNLLSNARKFTQEGHITLGIETLPPYVHIWVEDTGSGIARELQEQIFEPFIVGDNSDRHSSGIGLGLTISRHLVALHGGVITLESTPGKGTTFHVYLPLPNLGEPQLITQPPIVPEKLNLVYIADRKDLPPDVELLKQQGTIQVYQLAPGEVKAQLLKLEPSILAFDTTTASENNWQILDYLRTTPSLALLPLMLYNSNSPSSVKTEESSAIGITNILLKPFNNQTLQLFLETLRPHQNGNGVLIVDDEIGSLDLYEKIVQTALPGLPIYRVTTGQEAINLLKKIVPVLVLIDLVMPELDGCDVIEWLRTNPLTRNVPVIVISGKVLSSQYIERLEFAQVAYQSKDILKSEETAKVLQQVLESKIQVSQYNSRLVKRTIAYLQHNYNRPLSLQKIAKEIGINRTTLLRNFREEIGITPWEYLRRYRIKEAKVLLETTSLNITEIASKVGFEDSAYFSRDFRIQTGQSPKEYRQTIGLH
ncbi:MAG TPA: ATP-binding protein [Chloroflexia bacterium]|nr:ATP-binding protein [Chloroflexia bacterium]